MYSQYVGGDLLALSLVDCEALLVIGPLTLGHIQSFLHIFTFEIRGWVTIWAWVSRGYITRLMLFVAYFVHRFCMAIAPYFFMSIACALMSITGLFMNRGMSITGLFMNGGMAIAPTVYVYRLTETTPVAGSVPKATTSISSKVFSAVLLLVLLLFMCQRGFVLGPYSSF